MAGKNVEDVYALSPLQEGILFHCLYGADDSLYVTTFSCTLHGLDPAAFECAWDRALERHAALRTAFAWEGLKQPVQVVGRRVKAAWETEDWRALDPAEGDARWEGVLREEARKLQKLTRAPLLRLALYRTGEAEHRFVFSHHHLILDGWSLPLLLGEVFATYEGERGGSAAALPPVRPYRDFIAWLQKRDLGAAEEHWRRTLAGFVETTVLGVDRGTAGAPVGEVGVRDLHLAPAEVETLRAFGRASGLTLNTLVQGAWALVLARASGNDDVVYGVSVAGRPAELSGVERMLGVFTNTLPLRARAEAAAPAGDWLRRLQESQVEMRRHEHSPLAQVQKWSDVPAGLPLFENIVVFENYPLERGLTEDREGLVLRGIRAHIKTSSPLLVTVKPADGLSLTLAFDRARFDAAAAARLQEHWRTLLVALARDPRRPLGDLESWTEAERHQILVEWNDTTLDGGAAGLLHQAFVARAAAAPGAEALVAGETRLTYGDLQARAAALAAVLQGLGVGPEERVAVCLSRSVGLVVALLGVLQAGGSYVPLDPTYPRERLRLMLEDSRAAVLITEEGLAGLLAADRWETARALLLDPATGTPVGGEAPAARVRSAAAEAGPGNLAYLIYTSGSTGRPKGVAIEHRSAAALVAWARGVFPPEDLAGVLFATSVCFDLSVFELFVPLSTGGRVILAGNALALPGLPAAGEVTLVNTVPSVVAELVREGGLPPSVRTVNLAGEPLPRPLVERIYAQGKVARVLNLYGPSEDTTYSTFAVLAWGDGGAPPIGRPVDGTRAYVVDRASRPVPLGVPGELLLGGTGLARGYFDRPALTAERLVPDPFSGIPGARLYRTGDLVRHRPGGDLDFLGRLDHQVKIRGFRIEPGEIEAVLSEHPAVAAAAVVPREGLDGRSRLIAYLVTGEAAVPASELRRFLGERLPEHMLPAGFVFLAALPLTGSGKVDRRALPAFDGPAAEGAGAFTPARNAVEEALAAVWAKVLGVERVGIHDSFFDLGGDSILSIQVVARAREAGLRLTPQQIFERRTVARVAEVAERTRGAAVPQREVAAGPVPLTPVQRRFLDARPADPHWFNQALVLEVAEPLVPARLAAAVERVAAHHGALRLRFEERDGEWRQVSGGPQGGAASAVADLSGLPAEAWRSALESAAAAVQGSLALDRGPLLRAVGFPGPAGGPHRLLLVVHHLVIDGVSWRILVEDLESAYRAPGSPLPAGTPFQEWAHRLAEHARTPEVRGELGFWRERVPAALRSLPVDFPGGENTVGAAQGVVVSLDPEETGALLHETAQAGRAHIDEILLAALALAAVLWTAEEELWVELEGHGREEIAGLDLTRTVGWLTAIHPVRLRAPRGSGPAAVLREVKEELRRIPGRGLGYGLLGLPAIEGGLPAHPLPQVVFNYLGQLDRGAAEGSLFRLAPEDAGLSASPRQGRWHLLEVNGGVREGRLRLAWTFSRRVHRPETVQALADGYLEALRGLIRSAGRESWVTSDFPLLRLAPAEAAALLHDLPEGAEDVYPLSPLQRGLHFHALFEPAGGVYFTQMSCELAGPLYAVALRRSWESVLARHAALRTSFLWEGREEPLQVVHRNLDLPWDERDWRGLDPAAAEERCAAFLAADREAGVDLARPPLLRCALLRLSDDRWRFVWSVHHLLIDGWCQSLLFGEVFARYAAAVRGEELALPTAPLYRDYIAWLSRQDLAAAEAHWRRELAGFTAPTPLGIDRAPAGRPADDTGYDQREVALPAAVTAGLGSLARRNDLTMGTVLTGLWALLLGRLSGEGDILFGTAVSGRPADLPGAEATVGLFLNTLPVRVSVQGEERFLPWLAALQARQVEARRHEHAPLVEIQGWSEVPRGQSLFESLLVVENYPVDPAVAAGLGSGGAGGLEVRGVRSYDRVGYPLTVQALPGEPILLRFKFVAARFEAVAIEEALRQLASLCQQAVEEPERTLAGFSLVTAGAPLPDPAEELAEPLFPPVPASLREVAARWPERVAIRDAWGEMSYSDLLARSGEIARALRLHGLDPGAAVAVQGESGGGRIAALVGVLAAGGVLLALDAHLPWERRRLMLSQAGACYALAVGAAAVGDLAGLADVLEVDPRTGRTAVTDAGAEVLPDVASEAPAYVFFTSGTTAVPRAVLGCHKGLSHFVAWQREMFGAAPGDRVAHLTGLSFDVVLREIFLPLTSGATLCVPPEEGLDPAALLPWMEREGITLLHTVPALAQTWLEALPPGVSLGALRCVFFAGEPLTDTLVRRWRAAFPRAEVINLYGPTETTLAKCWHRVEPEPRAGVQPVGRPLPQTQALVLAGDRRCGVGEPGEIVLRTPFRSLGYLNAPDENRRRFVPNPFGPGERDLLYRTGDRGRYRPDGVLEILGRLDDEVKVRGVRIDPNEVAAVLAQHPGVAAVAVMARKDPQGQAALVAWLVPREGSVPADLRTHAAAHLPPAAVPAAFVLLERLPLTANGKVDRRALPEPAWSAEREGGAAGRPRTPVEEAVAAIWSEVLKRERIGVEESFFDLGGHSLRALQILARLRRTLDVDVPIHHLFETPTVTGLAREAERLLRERSGSAVPPLRPAPPEAELPLSFAQERLWFLDQMDPGNPVYNVNAGVRLRGSLDSGLLARCLGRVVARHDALCASFDAVNGRAHLVLGAPPEISLPSIDLAALPAERREAEMLRLGAEQMNQPFDLRRAPLLCASLVRMNAEEHALLLTFHHIVADAWSIGLFLHETGVLYEAFRRGRPSPWPELPLRYADFAWWQRQWLRGKALEAELAFWRQRLDGAPEIFDLPTDRPRPAFQSFRGGRVTREWPAPFAALVRRLARDAAATPFMVLLAALQTFLYRVSGQDDVVVGTPVAGRGRVELEGLVGLFVNSLVLRSRLAPSAGFGELLRQVRGGVLEAYVHQDVPFEKLVEQLRPERNLAHNPLFQVMLVMQNAPVPERIDTDLSLEALEHEAGTARLDLTLSATETPGGLFLLVDYAADLFDASTARRWMAHLVELLTGAAEEPARPIASLALLSAPERHQLLREWNDTGEAFPAGLCLHHLFEERARTAPEALAVVAGEEAWSYGELDRRANGLARHLCGLGVGPEVRVGLAVHRSPDMLLGLLAILKAGGAYVPLDPDYPADRLARMLEDAAPAVLITREAELAKLPRTAARTVRLDADREAFAGQKEGPFASGAEPVSLAYVIYTSGSTGRPVGVMLDHAGVVNTLFWRRREFDLRPEDRVLQNISLSFDPSVWQIFGALMNGACLVLPPAEGHKDADALVDLMARQRVTVADFPPSFLRVLVEHPGIRQCPLRHVFAGGEALPPPVRDAFVAALDAELHNVYGPTETSIDATFWRCRRASPPGPVPIGRPMANKQILLLDPRLEPVPPGIPGELAIAGSGLARGYHGRPELTADRFRPHPGATVPGARLYRTGDLARFQADGTLQFLGRTDHQVKVRGVRMELQEIESALAAHPDVREGVVLAHKAGTGDNRLEAWVVAAGEVPPSARSLGDHLRGLLPQAMIPTAFFVVNAIPRSPAGKVDRQALAVRREAVRVQAEAPAAPPRSPEEAALVEIWREVLGLQQVGIEDNFFEVGGDSILSIQIVARATRRGLRLSPRQVFLHQTIAELAAVAEPLGAALDADQGPVVGEVPLTPIQRWFFEQTPPDPWHFNQAVRLELARPLAPELLDRAVAHLVQHHDALRLRFHAGPDEVRQEHAGLDEPVPFAALDLSALPAGARESAAAAAEAALQESLNLARGPLLRATLFLAGDEAPSRLLLAVHHLVVDGVSWRVLLEDLQTACVHLAAVRPVELPLKTTSFRGWAERLAAHARAPALDRELEHWTALLGRLPAPLPVDLPGAREGQLDSGAETVAVSLASETTAGLLQEVPAVYHARIDEVLLAAFALALARWTGQRAALVELEGHGREAELFEGVDLSRTVGWFTTIYPVRLELGRDASPGSALRTVKEQVRAVPGRGIGYGLLRHLRGGEAEVRLRALPRPEISFNYLGQFERSLAEDGLFRPGGEAAGRTRSPRWQRRHLLEVNGLLAGGRLHFEWRYSAALHRRATIEKLAGSFLAALGSILDSCRQLEVEGRTISDFPLIQGNQEQLDRLMRKFGRPGEKRGTS